MSEGKGLLECMGAAEFGRMKQALDCEGTREVAAESIDRLLRSTPAPIRRVSTPAPNTEPDEPTSPGLFGFLSSRFR